MIITQAIIFAIFKYFWDEYKKAHQDKTLENPSPELLKRLMGLYTDAVHKLFALSYKNTTMSIQTGLKRDYNKFMHDLSIWQGDLNTKGTYIGGWTMENIKADVRQELEKRMALCFDLIKISNAKHREMLQERFFGIMSANTNITPTALAKALNIRGDMVKLTKKQQALINDQTTKFESTISNIQATRAGAIAFKWETEQDFRVVGDPEGLYPKPTKAHGDHFHRNGQVYFLKEAYPDSWIYTEKLVRPDKLQWNDFMDGMPGMPINCRCVARYYYDLQDIPPAALKGVLTKRGREYCDGKIELQEVWA